MSVSGIARLPDEWREALAGEPRYRADQVFGWVHGKGVTEAGAMTNLSKSLRAKLEGSLELGLRLERVHHSDDDTRKLILRIDDESANETVLLPLSKRLDDADAAAADTDDEDEGLAPSARVTQCISTQVGCAMGCVFCASGIAGLTRHLTAAEVMAQVLLGRAQLAPHERLRNVVFMGMGEPLHNYDATARVIRLLTHPEGLALSPRRVTVSTSGLVPAIDRLG
ncbi:MAG: radical SAM protein, partial [Myxococcota bacterium]